MSKAKPESGIYSLPKKSRRILGVHLISANMHGVIRLKMEAHLQKVFEGFFGIGLEDGKRRELKEIDQICREIGCYNGLDWNTEEGREAMALFCEEMVEAGMDLAHNL